MPIFDRWKQVSRPSRVSEGGRPAFFGALLIATVCFFVHFHHGVPLTTALVLSPNEEFGEDTRSLLGDGARSSWKLNAMGGDAKAKEKRLFEERYLLHIRPRHRTFFTISLSVVGDRC